MASSTKEHSVPQSRNDIEVPTGPTPTASPRQLPRVPSSIFANMSASVPESWPSGASALVSP